MRIYTEYCDDRDDRTCENMQRGMIAGMAGGILCWLGVNVLVFTDNPAIAAVILLIWIIFMIFGIVHFSG